MNFLFAWRYFKAKKSTNAINIIAWISVGAIVIGTTALIMVLSVFNGFEDLVKSLYSSFYTDLKIAPANGKTFTLSAAQIQKLKNVGGIRNYALVIEEKAFLQNGDQQSVPIFLKGVDENYRYVTGVASHIIRGNYDLGNSESPKLVMGAGLEGALGIQADRNIFILRIYLPRKSASDQIDPLNDISNDSIRTAASFVIQQDFDNKYAVTNIDFVRRALRLDSNQYTQVEVALKDPSAVDEVQDELMKLMGNEFKVLTRYQQNQSLYSVINMERWIIYGVLCLILVVAAFNMIGALTMLVLEKQKDISVLHALGGSRQFIQRIFLSEGLLLAAIGTVGGMLLALLLVYLQVRFHLIALEGDSFLIDYFPVKLRLTDFVLVGVTVFVIALLAAWLPSRKAGHAVELRSE